MDLTTTELIAMVRVSKWWCMVVNLMMGIFFQYYSFFLAVLLLRCSLSKYYKTIPDNGVANHCSSSLYRHTSLTAGCNDCSLLVDSLVDYDTLPLVPNFFPATMRKFYCTNVIDTNPGYNRISKLNVL